MLDFLASLSPQGLGISLVAYACFFAAWQTHRSYGARRDVILLIVIGVIVQLGSIPVFLFTGLAEGQ